MKFKNTFLIVILLSGVACSNLDSSYKESLNSFQVYQDILENYEIDQEWWKEYNNSELNRIVDYALENNNNLKQAGITVNKALYQANILGAELVPTFSASLGSSASKNIKTGASSTIKHSASIDLSYELDLWKKLSNTKSAQEWEYKATIEDLEATKLSLINNVVNTYFNIVYLNDAIKIIENKISSYEEINAIMKNKFNYGTITQLDLLQSEQSLLTLRNSLASYQNDKKIEEQTLRDLLNLKPEENIEIETSSLLSFKDIGVDLNVPISVIANRPDVKAAEYRLTKSFKNVEATKASLYPSISIQSSLSSSSNKTSTALNFPIAVGSISINLPFLNWNTLKWNIKTDEASYESAKLDFETAIVSSLNEIDTYYNSYNYANTNYSIQEKNFTYQSEIEKHYQNRYENGYSEFKLWLEARINEKDSELTLLKAKFDLIQAENKIFQALTGKASRK